MLKTKFKFCLLLICFLFPSYILGVDFYVDSNSSDGDGSKEKPFSKISKALEKGGKDIFVKNGTYTENLNLGKNVKIKGEDKNKVIILGSVKTGNDSVLENLSVKKGGIFVGDKISSTLNKLIIKDSGTGIMTEGSGKIKVSNCEIGNNTKGFYVQRGKSVDIRYSVIYSNGGEGIDLRDNIDGIVSNNTIKNNSEGGIEVIAGGTNLTISGNTIQNNKASGIAIQYYKSANKLGALKIENNTISGNGNFGIVCKNPSGGDSGGSYWTNSVKMSANKISGNKSGLFSSFCKFSDDLENIATKTAEELEKEKKAEEEKEKIEEEKLKKEEEEKKKIEEEKLLKENEELAKLEREKKETEIKKNMENIKENFSKKNTEIENLKKEIESRSKIKTFFIGPDFEKLNNLNEKNLELEKNISDLKNLESNLENQEIKNEIENKIKEISDKKKNFDDFIKKEKDKFGLLVWIFEIFRKIQF